MIWKSAKTMCTTHYLSNVNITLTCAELPSLYKYNIIFMIIEIFNNCVFGHPSLYLNMQIKYRYLINKYHINGIEESLSNKNQNIVHFYDVLSRLLYGIRLLLSGPIVYYWSWIESLTLKINIYINCIFLKMALTVTVPLEFFSGGRGGRVGGSVK